MTRPTLSIITTTVSNQDDANKLAQTLMEARLAACVQIDGPIRSIYRWQGKICNEAEYRLTCKMPIRLVDAAVELLRANHPYELPELVIAIVQSTDEYANWANGEA